jgi:protein TonB
MTSYSGAQPQDRWKAIVAVAAVHAALAAVILTGLNGGRIISGAVEQLKVFDVTEPPPPPPPPARQASKPKQAEGAPAKKAEPMPVVAPPAPRPSPVPAAKLAGQGSAAASGAAAAGSGTGAGWAGSGPGGGGTDFSRFTPARLVRNLTSGDYRSIGAGRLPAGRAMGALRIETDGVPSGRRIVRSSGDPIVDRGLCPLIEARLRFRPALDDQGRPIPSQLQYVATWAL